MSSRAVFIIQLGVPAGLAAKLLSDDKDERVAALLYAHQGLDRALERALDDYQEEEE